MKKSKKEKKQLNFISNIKLKIKMLLIYIFAFLPSVLLFATIAFYINGLETNRKNYIVEAMSNVTEQYVNTSIENIVAIAKSVYTNNTLYKFLNTQYKSSVEYYDAFHNLSENNSLIISENSNIKSFTIYTDNDTILNGGNICRLSEVKDQKWYTDFIKINKNMILVCDSETSNLSLIRKLDYYKVDAGDCFLKIDFNSYNLQCSFEDLKFDGTTYVVSGNTILYSNVKNAAEQSMPDLTGYELFSKNYYTVEIQYYIHVNQESIYTIISDYKFYFIPVLIIFIANMICILLIIRNISSRINHITSSYDKFGNFDMLRHSSFGNDEIGHMFNDCLDISSKLKHNMREYEKLSTLIDDYRAKNNKLLTQLLNYDAKTPYAKLMHPLTVSDTIMTNDEEITLGEEIKILNQYIQKENEASGKKINISVESTLDATQTYYILPLSVVALAADVIRRSENSGNDPQLKIFFSENKNKFITTLTSPEFTASSSMILKLRAIFENDSGYDDWKFIPGYKYNPYNRLKHYYEDKINVDIKNSDNTIIQIIIDKSQINKSNPSNK